MTTATPARTHYETWPETTAEMLKQAPDVCKGFGSMYQKLMAMAHYRSAKKNSSQSV